LAPNLRAIIGGIILLDLFEFFMDRFDLPFYGLGISGSNLVPYNIYIFFFLYDILRCCIDGFCGANIVGMTNNIVMPKNYHFYIEKGSAKP